MSSPSKIRKSQPSASSSKVPTIQSLRTMKRSLSFNIIPKDSHNDRATSSPCGQKVNQAGCDQMLKVSLTGILNTDAVKSDARGRKVQNLLMETERDLRRQRRALLSEQRGRGFLEVWEKKRNSYSI